MIYRDPILNPHSEKDEWYLSRESLIKKMLQDGRLTMEQIKKWSNE